jgi:hypothetical protein
MNFCGVIDIAETSTISNIKISEVSMTAEILINFWEPIYSLKGKIQPKYLVGMPDHYLKKKIRGSLDLVFYLRGVIDTVKYEFSNFLRNYLGKYEAIFKTAITS